MLFAPDNLAEIERAHQIVLEELREIISSVVLDWMPLLKSPRAREYVTHGLARRLGLIRRCIQNVFAICPVAKESLLDQQELHDLDINLHAFVINVYGSLDNLAWVCAFEKLKQIPGRGSVGLFNKERKRYLAQDVIAYLEQPRILTWFEKYAKDYRDALAHRIPLYVPPSGMTPADRQKHAELDAEIAKALESRDHEGFRALIEAQQRIGSVLPVFRHSFDAGEGSPAVALHPQMIADARTLMEIVRKIGPPELTGPRDYGDAEAQPT